MPPKGKVRDTDRGWRAMLKSVGAASGTSYARVGVLADDSKGGLHQVDPDTGKASDLTIAEIAAVLEYGTEDGHIPSRSFLRSTFDRMRPELQEDARKLLLQILDGKMSVATALAVLGNKLTGATKLTITDGEGVPPPNAPSTIAMKGSSRPLFDTGAMKNAITFAVVLSNFSLGMGNAKK